jgi:hypothetical protein
MNQNEASVVYLIRRFIVFFPVDLYIILESIFLTANQC